jgi:exopolysaccharide production protein ExoQ
MPVQLATLVLCVGIGGLFWLDRDRDIRPSAALWIPTIWLWIAGSREVSAWMWSFGFRYGGSALDSSDLTLEGNPIDRLVYTALLLIGVAVLFRRGQSVGTVLRANLPILLFFFYCALSTLWSDYSFVAFKRWSKAIGDLVVVLIVLTDPQPLAALKRLFSRTAFLLIPISVLLIKYYPDLGKEYKMSGLPVYIGVTGHKNELGMTCLVLGLGCLWQFLGAYQNRTDPGRTRRLVAYGTVLVMALWLFHMANSMTSLSCFIMAAGLMVSTRIRYFRQRPWPIHLLVAGIIVASISTLFLGLGGVALQEMGRDPTLTGRSAIWNLVLNMAGNSWFGAGFESFWVGQRFVAVKDFFGGYALNEAHNGYIEVYLNLGWVGAVLLGTLIVTGYRKALIALRQDQEAGWFKFVLFVVAVVYSFTEAGFRMRTPIWIAFLLATIAIPNDRPLEESESLCDDRAGSSDDWMSAGDREVGVAYGG